MSTTVTRRPWSNADGEPGAELSPKRPTVGIRHNCVLQEAFRKAQLDASSAKESSMWAFIGVAPCAAMVVLREKIEYGRLVN